MKTAMQKSPRRWLGLASLTLSGLVLGLDVTILITALPTLSTKLGATTSQLQWMSAAYTLAMAGLLLPAGVLGDRLGRRRMLVVGLLIFAAGSIGGSLMTTADGVVWMRALMGVGGAILLPLSLSILPSLFAEEERQKAIGIAAGSTFIALPLGPLVAGWLLNNYEWQSIFLINVVMVALALPCAWFFVPESKDPAPRRLDWPGVALQLVGVWGVVYAIIEQPANGWTDARVLVGFIVGGLFLAAFVAWELRTASPLIDLELFLNRRFAWGTVAFVVVGYAMNGALFVISPYLQIVEGNDAQRTGLRLLPMIGAVLVAAVSADWLNRRLGTKIMVAGGLLIVAGGLLTLAQVGPGTGYGLIASGLFITGLGIGLAMIPAVDALLGSVPETQTGAGTGLMRMLQNVAASLGVAIIGSMLNGVYRSELGKHLGGLPPAVQEAAQKSVAVATVVAHRLPPKVGLPLLQAAHDAYSLGMASVLVWTAVVVVAGAILIGAFMPARAQARKTLAEQVA